MLPLFWFSYVPSAERTSAPMGYLTGRSGHHPGTGPVKNGSFASRNPCREKAPSMGRAYAGKGSSMESRYRIDTKNPMLSNIIEMIRYEHRPVIHEFDPVEIMEDEKPGEPEIDPPERTGNPCIQVIIVRRRCVVCHYRRALIGIIVVYHRLIGVLLGTRRPGLIGGIRPYG